MLGLLLLSATGGFAANSTWSSGTTWSTATWSPLGAPTSTSSVTVAANTTTITNSANVTINSFTLSSGTISFASGMNIMANATTLLGGTLNTILAGTGNLTKSGTGTATLSSNNTYTGGTFITGGNLIITTSGALGTTANSTTVSSGATLELSGGFTFAENLTLNGTGSGGIGALDSVSGLNTLSNTTTLSGGSTLIDADAGTLTIAGAINGATQSLKIGGAGNVSITGIIGTFAGSLTKNGTGTLTLSAANSFTGGATLNSGLLFVNRPSTGALGATGGNVTVNGGTLQFGQNGSQSYHISGTGGNILISNATFTTINFPLSFSGNVSATGTGLTLSGGAGAASTMGNLTMASGSSLNASANVTVSAGGTLLALGNLTILGAHSLLNATPLLTGSDTNLDPTYTDTSIQGPSGAGQSLQSQSNISGPADFYGNVAIINTYTPSPSSSTTGLTTIHGIMTLNSSSVVTTMQIGGTGRGASSGGYDAFNLKAGSTLNLNGQLTVTLINGFNPVAGNSFLLFRKADVAGGSGSLVGSFSSIDYSGAVLGSGLLWDDSNLYNTGVLDVITAIPEPSVVAALCGAVVLGAAIIRRRRSRAAGKAGQSV